MHLIKYNLRQRDIFRFWKLTDLNSLINTGLCHTRSTPWIHWHVFPALQGIPSKWLFLAEHKALNQLPKCLQPFFITFTSSRVHTQMKSFPSKHTHTAPPCSFTTIATSHKQAILRDRECVIMISREILHSSHISKANVTNKERRPI